MSSTSSAPCWPTPPWSTPARPVGNATADAVRADVAFEPASARGTGGRLSVVGERTDAVDAGRRVVHVRDRQGGYSAQRAVQAGVRDQQRSGTDVAKPGAGAED